MSCDLNWNAEVTCETRAPSIFPIARNDYGRLFYMTVSGPRTGEVLFGGLPQDGAANYSRVADRFSSFLDVLGEYPIE